MEKVIPISKASLSETDHMLLYNISDKSIENAKISLLSNHEKKLTKSLYYVSPYTLDLIKSRVFFVKYNCYLVLCGIYSVNYKYYKIDADTKIEHEVFDYLLYSNEDGFYFLRGCSAPLVYSDYAKCTSPVIYLETRTDRKLLTYGAIYQQTDFLHTYAIYNQARILPNERHRYDIHVFKDTFETIHVSNATLFFDLPMTNGHFIYTKEKELIRWKTYSKLVDIYTNKKISILENCEYGYPYKYETTLSCVMSSYENPSFPISDSDHIYFYINKNSTVAYDVVMTCIEKYGNITRMDNLFKEDSSVNYIVRFSKKDTPQDIINFVFGVICKSNSIYPVIMGCPLHAVVELLCSDCDKNPYALPPHSIDELSANNVVNYIRKKFVDLSNSQIVHMLGKTYGMYAIATIGDKCDMYVSSESLCCTYLPSSIEAIIGEKIDGTYVRKLSSSTISTKWKSEYFLFRTIFAYFPNCIMHYHTTWLGSQHIDIFIPNLMVGIEYQGSQHYKSSKFFGGDSAFNKQQLLDSKKKILCKDNNVLLIEWPYDLPICAINLIVKLLEIGITDIPTPNPFLEPPSEEQIDETKSILRICQFTLDGKFINSFLAYDDASVVTGISKTAIQKAVYGYHKSAGNYQWRRMKEMDASQNIAPILEPSNSNLNKAVIQMSTDGEIVAEYASIGKAEKATGINRKSIRCVILGTQKTAGGYYWIEKSSI